MGGHPARAYTAGSWVRSIGRIVFRRGAGLAGGQDGPGGCVETAVAFKKKDAKRFALGVFFWFRTFRRPQTCEKRKESSLRKRPARLAEPGESISNERELRFPLVASP